MSDARADPPVRVWLPRLLDLRIVAFAFALGLVALLAKRSRRRRVFVYPRPDNVDEIQYRDRSGQCFQAVQEPVPCEVVSRFKELTKLLPQT